uniref:Uncharacterized protein n=1 Tax=Zea mays TaxID=4577 RepID=B6TBF1_MAIZE|nr:hypothetical protein [Zea mays]
MGVAAGRAAAMVAAAAAAAAVLLLLAGGAHADCYDDCFKDCMARFKSMRDYCSYACEKVCDPDATLQRPLPLWGQQQRWPTTTRWTRSMVLSGRRRCPTILSTRRTATSSRQGSRTQLGTSSVRHVSPSSPERRRSESARC